jgi:predicted Rdx family selenoprotein
VVKTYLPPTEQGQDVEAKKVLLWDRKAEGGFPGTLKVAMALKSMNG